MTDSIVVVRLTRNLRYKLTYVRIFETLLESGPSAEVAELLRGLIQAQQTAIAALSSYVRRLDVATQDLEMNDKLLTQASSRTDLRSQLRFIHDGFERAIAWYKMQLVDRQMAADPDLKELLLELGELDAAKLWRTEAVMEMLKIQVKPRETEWETEPYPEPPKEQVWRSRLMDDVVGRPSWPSQAATSRAAERNRPRPQGPKPRRKGRPNRKEVESSLPGHDLLEED